MLPDEETADSGVCIGQMLSQRYGGGVSESFYGTTV